ncbi:hypothetical protein BH23GEM6_BH23GEM6_18560 [soil metagenome]
MSDDDSSDVARRGRLTKSPGRSGERGTSEVDSAESREREYAWERGKQAGGAHARDTAENRDPYTGLTSPYLEQRAFAVLAESVRDFAVFLLNPEGVITFWGESARLVKWWTRAEAEGAHLRLLYLDGGSDDGTADAHLQEAEETGEYTGEGQRMRSDGSTFWAGVSLTALRDGDGQLIGFAKVTRDLTARRAADAALKAAHDRAEEARKAAEEANRTKGLFLATMSHEIRTPINAAMGYVDLLDLEIAGPINDKQRTQLERIRASNLHLLGIVDEVLDFARLDAGRMKLAKTVGRMARPVRDALQMVDVQAQSKGIALTDSSSILASDAPYLGDEDRVRQILVVLLSNAVKFTPSGGRITVSAGLSHSPPKEAQLKGEGPWVYTRVEDTGSGIPPDRLPAVFEPFEQADMNLTRQHGGAGLGLSIAKRLAVLMEGDLTFRTQPGMGTSFFLWLPASAKDALETTLAGSEKMDAPGPRPLQPVRDAILVDLERILHAYMARLRSDPQTPGARQLSDAEMEDHLATFLADLASMFSGMGLDGQNLKDSTAIQRTVAERHGVQRRRLGWSREEVEREFDILEEEVIAAIRRRVPEQSEEQLKGALEAVHTFIRSAESVSLGSFDSSEE